MPILTHFLSALVALLSVEVVENLSPQEKLQVEGSQIPHSSRPSQAELDHKWGFNVSGDPFRIGKDCYCCWCMTMSSNFRNV